jgi:hypothetical protein
VKVYIPVATAGGEMVFRTTVDKPCAMGVQSVSETHQLAFPVVEFGITDWESPRWSAPGMLKF